MAKIVGSAIKIYWCWILWQVDQMPCWCGSVGKAINKTTIELGGLRAFRVRPAKKCHPVHLCACTNQMQQCQRVVKQAKPAQASRTCSSLWRASPKLRSYPRSYLVSLQHVNTPNSIVRVSTSFLPSRSPRYFSTCSVGTYLLLEHKSSMFFTYGRRPDEQQDRLRGGVCVSDSAAGCEPMTMKIKKIWRQSNRVLWNVVEVVFTVKSWYYQDMLRGRAATYIKRLGIRGTVAIINKGFRKQETIQPSTPYLIYDCEAVLQYHPVSTIIPHCTGVQLQPNLHIPRTSRIASCSHLSIRDLWISGRRPLIEALYPLSSTCHDTKVKLISSDVVCLYVSVAACLIIRTSCRLGAERQRSVEEDINKSKPVLCSTWP